jgi:hypothetical protein
LARCEAPVEPADDVLALAAAVITAVAPMTMATVAAITIRLLIWAVSKILDSSSGC